MCFPRALCLNLGRPEKREGDYGCGKCLHSASAFGIRQYQSWKQSRPVTAIIPVANSANPMSARTRSWPGGCILTAITATCFLLIVAVTAPFHPSGAAAPLGLVCAGLWLSGFFYAELPATSALLLALAPAVALLPVRTERHSQWRVLAYRTTFVTVPVAIAVVLALHASPPLDY